MAPLLPMPAGSGLDSAHQTHTRLGEGRVEVSIGPSNRRLHADRYDTLESTLHLGNRDYGNHHVIAGLRLTPVARVTDSLSWSMLPTGMHGAVQEHHRPSLLDQNGDLWDLTRLVTSFDRGARPGHTIGAMLELFALGAGLIHQWTPERQRRDVRWIFTTTGPLLDCLLGLGWPVTALAAGRISPTDASKSYFCTLDPGSAIRHICSRAAELTFSYRHIDVGLRKAALMGSAIAYSSSSFPW